MRRGKNNSILYNHDGRFLGFCLGADLVAEHEIGIERLANSFGLPLGNSYHHPWYLRKPKGIKRRSITRCPKDNMVFLSTNSRGDDDTLFAFRPHTNVFTQAHIDQLDETLWFEPNDILSTAWADRDFGIRMKGEIGKALLEELYTAFLRMDISFIMANELGHSDAKVGLCIVIRGRLSKAVDGRLRERDKIVAP